MIGFSAVKGVTIPEGIVKKIVSGAKVLWEKVAAYTNLLPLAIAADGTPYNGGLGYKTGYRINSSRNEVAASGCCCTGFIPVTVNDTVRIQNIKKSAAGSGYVLFYEADMATGASLAYESSLYGTEVDGVYTFQPGEIAISAIPTTVRYMRISTGTIDDTTVITVNEEIV